MVKRRNFIMAGLAAVAGLFTGKTRAAAPAANPEHLQKFLGKYKMEEDPTAYVGGEKFLVVHGAVLPSLPSFDRELPLHPVHIRMVSRHENANVGDMQDWGDWFEMVPDKDRLRPDRFPHTKPFRNMSQVEVGTIDELVESYRKTLVRATTIWKEAPGVKDRWGEAQALYAKMGSGNHKIETSHCPHHKAYIQQRADMGAEIAKQRATTS